MENLENLELRILVAKSGYTYKMIAAQMGISRVWLSKMMSRPLSQENRDRILEAVRELQEG